MEFPPNYSVSVELSTKLVQTGKTDNEKDRLVRQLLLGKHWEKQTTKLSEFTLNYLTAFVILHYSTKKPNVNAWYFKVITLEIKYIIRKLPFY